MTFYSSHDSPLKSSDHDDDGKIHILVAASGSVATIKLPQIVRKLSSSVHAVSIRIILTDCAAKFLVGQSLEQQFWGDMMDIPGVEAIYRDEDEWSKPWVRGASILHIELRKWAHIMLIAPLSANTLAKIANGMSDNLLTSTVRAWDTTAKVDGKDGPDFIARLGRKIILVAPAMNTAMWDHPITEKHLNVLENEWGYKHDRNTGWFYVIPPQPKTLACGDTGNGAMAEWSEVVRMLLWHLSPYSGKSDAIPKP